MKKLLRFCGAACATLFLCQAVNAAGGGQVQTDTSLPFQNPVAYASTTSMRTDGFDWASGQLILTSATVATQSFTDGSISTVTIFVTSAPIGGMIYPGQVCVAGVCANQGIGLANSATSQYIFPYDALGFSSNTAQGICNWILGNTQLQGEVTCNAPAGQSVVYASSTVVGLFTNYAVSSTSGPQVGFGSGKVGSTTMTGGANTSYTLGSSSITLAANPFSTGFQVYLTTGSNISLGGLSSGSTYYTVNAGNNMIGLASSLANAIANPPITIPITSSQTKSGTDTFTLTPLPAVGAPTLTWVVSNDNSHWVPLTTTTFGQTVTSPAVKVSGGVFLSTGSVNLTDFGHLNYSWLGVAVSSITSGGINIQSYIAGSAP